ncbi:MAG: DUF6391 domain-containing protein [Microcoleaceae cyanobacterium]
MTDSNFADFPFHLEFAPSPHQDQDFLKQLEFIPGLKELLTVRQVHALEHATVWVLNEMNNPNHQPGDNQRWGGMSTDEGFYLYGQVASGQLEQAVQEALRRLTNGEWNLAVHPRCGTNISVGLMMTAGLAMGINWFLPKGPIIQLMGLGLAATVASQLSPDFGALAQKYLTTAIPFNLEIVEVTTTNDFWGRPSHFVRVQWCN